MAFTKITKDMNIISQLDDEPNDIGGMSAADLKAKFDEGGLEVKEKFNLLVDELISSASATSVGAVDPDGNSSDVQTELNAKAINNDVVHNTGDERVYGVKSFEDGLDVGDYCSIEESSNNLFLIGGTSSDRLRVGGGVTYNGTALELTSNKVTSINGSSTDTKYPSAKCVYDAIESKVSINRGVAHAGEFLVVGNDGKVTTMTMDIWAGGNY